MQINRVAVVGAGTMGSTIALAFIEHGLTTILKDVDDERMNNGLNNIDRLLQVRVNKGLPAEDAEKKRALLALAIDYTMLADADLVIEAVPESLDIKREVFEQLDFCCKNDTILASNTSSLSISQLASFTRRPDRVVGLHFFNPAHLMKLVEVIPGLDTSLQTVNTAITFGEALGKLAIRVEECASFLVNRLLGRYMNEALWCLQEGNASVEEIDKAACDYVVPIGPLALRDMNGADVGLSVAKFNFDEYGERFLPAAILEEMVKRNLLGQKTLAGFYTYDPITRKRVGTNPELVEILKTTGLPIKQPAYEFNVERLFLPMINEAFLVLQEKICAKEDLDPALMAGLGMRKGPLAMASDMGLDNCLEKIEYLYKCHGERFRPAPLLKRYVWARKIKVT